MNRRVGSVSLYALAVAISGQTIPPGAAQAQTTLPTIHVQHTHPVQHTHVTRAGSITHTHAIEHTHVVARPAAPRAAPAPATPAPAPAGPQYPSPPPMTASSEKFFTGAQVNAVPNARSSEALEIVPGLAVTQHSGEGKANQYYLRGFNLDHGSDLALYLDGMPLNMRTHGHGQGYADANFVIPELLASILARKGPYNAEDGDFSNAGSIYLQYLDKLPKGVMSTTGGSFGYGRVFGAKSWEHAGGNILGAGEATIYNGPWARPDSIRKFNTVLRWTRGTQEDGLSLTAMAYANRWYATDQLPLRAVYSGELSRWGTTDPTDGGNFSRFSLSGRWSQKGENNYSRIEAYAMRSNLQLYNDFTYFLSHHDIGDQFRQFDNRTMIGVNAVHGINYSFISLPVETRFGFQGRYDDIRLGLQESVRRSIYNAIRNDYVNEGSASFWTDTKVKWTPWLMTIAGARFDYYNARIQGIQPLSAAPLVFDGAGNPLLLWTAPWNSGTSNATLLSPKASIILGPFEKTEVFFNFGRGFHSTDARGTVQNVSTMELGDNDSYLHTSRIPLLTPSTGAEGGFRTKLLDDKLDSSISLFWIDLNSENQFEGDSGTTVFGRPSRRIGVEIANHYKPYSWLKFDGDVAIVNARYRGVDREQTLAWIELLQPDAIGWGTFLGNAPGNYLMNAVPIVATGTMEVGEDTGWFGALKYRYLGSRALTEDAWLRSPATGTLNARIGYRWADGWKFQLDAFNVTNSRSDAITYGYGSLIPSDPLYSACVNGTAAAAVCAVGVMDRHFKPYEPPAVRLTLGGPLSFENPIARLPDLQEPINRLPF